MLCIAKQLNDKLKEIKIEKFSDKALIDRTENFKQFCIGEWFNPKTKILMYSLGQFDEEDFKYTLEEVLVYWASTIITFSKHIEFHPLIIPHRVIVECGFNKYENVWVRMISDYIVASDMIITRYDVLIEKVNPNA